MTFSKDCPWIDLCMQKVSCEYPTYLTCQIRILKDYKNKTDHLNSFANNFSLAEVGLDVRSSTSDIEEQMTEEDFESLRSEGLI